MEQTNPRLTKEQVAEIKRRKAEGQTYDQIAAAMGVSTVTVWYKVGKKHANPDLSSDPAPISLADPNQLSLI